MDKSSNIKLIDCLYTLKTPQKTNLFISSMKCYLNERNFSCPQVDALDALIYGINCYQIVNGVAEQSVIFQIEPIASVLTIANIPQNTTSSIDISNIICVSFELEMDNTKLKLPQDPNNKFMRLLINKVFLDFMFNTDKELNIFLSGLVNLFEKVIISDESNIEDSIKEIWEKYDRDFSGGLNEKEFEKFIKELNIRKGGPEISEQFRLIDKNKNGKIEYNEFMLMFQSYLKGDDYKEIFDKYAIDPNDPNRNIGKIIPQMMKIFFNVVQKEALSQNEVNEIIITFKKNLSKDEKVDYISSLYKGTLSKDFIDKNLFLTKDEFMRLLYSPLLNVFDYYKMNKRHPMNRPLNDYFINSTNNTYIMGNQIYSYSSPEMYALSMLEGYRLVELNCYNGPGEDIVITSSYTMVSDIKLQDVLEKIKETAFIISPYPVILSIEHKLDDLHQKVLAAKLKEILGNLYILEPNNLPDYLPSPEELMGKFIIHCIGERAKKDRSKLTSRKDMIYESMFQGRKSFLVNLSNEIEKSYVQVKSISITKNAQMMMTQRSRKKEETTEIDEKRINNLMFQATVTLEELNGVLGLIKPEFKNDIIKKENFQPWDMLCLKASKILNFVQNDKMRASIIDFNQNSLMKVNPYNLTSSNYDTVKCWMLGCHCASINLQAVEDDFTLLNQIFFEANRKCGYLLKPPKLLPESTEIESYEASKGKITFDLISLISVHHLISKESLGIDKKNLLTLEMYVIGAPQDDKCNKKYKIDIVGNYYYCKIKAQTVTFDIYEKDLSFIYFKLYYNKKIIGRSVVPVYLIKEGYRNIKFYDNFCVKCNDTFLMAMVKTKMK